MLDVSIVILLSKLEWIGRQAGRRTDGQDHVLSQADALTKKLNDQCVVKHENMQKAFDTRSPPAMPHSLQNPKWSYRYQNGQQGLERDQTPGCRALLSTLVNEQQTKMEESKDSVGVG